MANVSIVIPNYNGIAFIKDCLISVQNQTILADTEVLVVDNGSKDGSDTIVEEAFPWVRLIRLEKNYGFCRAVNEGIRHARAPYVILLNNDTQIQEDFTELLLAAIKRDKKLFSCQAKMIQFHNRELLDDAGNYYNALGWAFARGKNHSHKLYNQKNNIFASCGGAAVYRKSVFEEIGYFDEAHFAYLEDIDIGYRAKIFGYYNQYVPEAVVYHVGSGTSGSRYNEFKIDHSSRNNVYMIYKNMPVGQILLNSPLLLAGFLIKTLFFIKKGFGGRYLKGLLAGGTLAQQNKKQKIRFEWKHFLNYCKIQLELWKNIGVKFTELGKK